MALIRRRDQRWNDKKEGHIDSDVSKPSSARIEKSFDTSILSSMLMALAVLVTIIILARVLALFLPKLWVLRIVTLLPVAACFWRAVSAADRSLQHRLLPLTVVSTTVFAQLPSFLGSAFAAMCIVAFSLSTIPSARPPLLPLTNHRPEKVSALPVLLATLLLVAILLTENFMVWVVSATFEAGQTVDTAPPPLQDNGRTIIESLMNGLTKSQVIGLRRLWNVQGALVACLGTSFVSAEVYGVRQLYSLGCRAVLTLAIARTIRTVSFLVTVVPSQNKFCYRQHFPYPPPSDWKEWIWVGLMPSKDGGCNDLIISGHATVTSTLACVASSVSIDPVFCIALWTMVALDYMVEIYEGFHYSVDMWLGMVLVCLLWRVLQHVEGPTPQSSSKIAQEAGFEQEEQKQSTPLNAGDVSSYFLSWNATVLLYSAAALVVFLQLVILPSWTVNFLIVIYTAITGVLYVGFALPNKDPIKASLYQHAAQHVLFCLLFMALGIYL
jgi:hypothetical protein